MRLIDADTTFDLLRSLGSRDYRREKGTIMDAMKMISHPEYTPTVDAVPVVRCAECKYSIDAWACTEKPCLCTRSMYGGNHKPDHFCSYGERRSDD